MTSYSTKTPLNQRLFTPPHCQLLRRIQGRFFKKIDPTRLLLLNRPFPSGRLRNSFLVRLIHFPLETRFSSIIKLSRVQDLSKAFPLRQCPLVVLPPPPLRQLQPLLFPSSNLTRSRRVLSSAGRKYIRIDQVGGLRSLSSFAISRKKP